MTSVVSMHSRLVFMFLAFTCSVMLTLVTDASPALQPASQTVTVVQGQSNTVRISAPRGGAPRLTVVNSKGKPTNEVTAKVVGSDRRTVEIQVSATKNAAPGEYRLMLVGRAGSTRPLWVDVRVHVKAAGSSSSENRRPPTRATLKKPASPLVGLPNLLKGQGFEVLDWHPKEQVAGGGIVRVTIRLDNTLALHPSLTFRIGGRTLRQERISTDGAGLLVVRLKTPNVAAQGEFKVNLGRSFPVVMDRTYAIIPHATPRVEVDSIIIHSWRKDSNTRVNGVLYKDVEYGIRYRIHDLTADGILRWEMAPDDTSGFELSSSSQTDGRWITNVPTKTATRFGRFTQTGHVQTIRTRLHVVTFDEDGVQHERVVPLTFYLPSSHQVVKRTRYIVENTQALKDILRFNVRGERGDVQGKSVGAAGEFNIGLVTIDGDLAFRLRSGPFGWFILWRSEEPELALFWEVESMKWRETKVGDACAVSRDGESMWGGQMEHNPNLDGYSPFHWVGHQSITDPDLLHTRAGDMYVRQMDLMLTSRPTLWNDHGVIARLERIVLLGPPGKSWQNAFTANYR